MSFALDLAARVGLLCSAFLLSLPLSSLLAVSGVPWIVVAVVALLVVMSATRPAAGLLGLAIALPLAFGLGAWPGHPLTAPQSAECFVLAFLVGAVARCAAEGRLFARARLARPGLALVSVVAASGLCAGLGQFADAGAAAPEAWRSATMYFTEARAADMLQPTIHWIEIATLAPFVELAVRSRPRLTILLAAMSVVLVLAALVIQQHVSTPPPASAGGGAMSRLELAKAALATAGQAPVFGVGLGQFPDGSNDFLQVLAELGITGLVAVLWLLWSVLTAVFTQAGSRAAVRPTADRWLLLIIAGVVVVSLPSRIFAALAPDTPEIVGAGPVEGEAEGVPYRVAERDSRWRFGARTRTVEVLMRWDPAGQYDCRLRIVVTGRPPDQVALRPDYWLPVRFAIPRGGGLHESPEVQFHVTSPTCRLLVGRIRTTR